jgi:hypothetical protein
MMMNDLVFNELSLTPRLADVATARQSMERFVETITATRRGGIANSLRIPESFFASSLADGYSIANWQHDQVVPKEKRLFLGLLATKSPYLDGLLGDAVADSFDRSDFLFDNMQAQGLGVAYLIDAVCISLSNAQHWNATSITIRFQTIDETTAEILDRAVEVRHVSEPDHVAVHVVQIRIQRLDAVNSGMMLWVGCNEVFDKLRFCAEVEEQMKSLTMGTGGIPLILRALRELQAVCESWQSGAFDNRLIPNTTREGEATLQQYGEERTFTKPDGVPEVFSWHIKRGAFRIYFIPNAGDRTCLVGYVGPHLRTVRNRN